jgi:GH25 family lysozyme M1 (1,4-beta-N-acetylmuramidase)
MTDGIDVAWPQGAHLPWAAEAGKIQFGMAKATEGTGVTDPDFGDNWDAMWRLRPDHRLPRFAYHEFHGAEDPLAQAQHLISTVRPHGLLPGDNLVAVIEESAGNAGVPAAAVAAGGVQFLHHVNALAPQHRVLVCADPSYIEAGNCAGMGGWYLWIEHYDVPAPTVPPPWDRWTFWQRGDTPVDTDVFNGTGEQLLAFTRMPQTR